MKPRPTELDAATSAARRAEQPSAGTHRRRVAHGADVHRAQQDPRARLSARRGHGPPHLRRNDLPAARGRDPDARDGPPDGGAAGLVHRPRRHAAVDAGRAQHGHDRRAAAGVRGRRRPRVRPVSRRRHRELHAVSRQRAGARTRGRRPARGRRTHRAEVRGRRRASRRDSATASTRATRAPRGSFRWRSSSRSRRITSR